EARVAYMLLIMAVYWVTESLPIGVTALIPVVLAPAFKIIPSKVLCPAYFSDSNMLFIGGLMLAISVEFWNLHRRMALLVLQLVGVQPRWLLLGFMLPTWFMSMWISNTATAAMMLPIVDAVLQELMVYDQLRKAEAAQAAADGADGIADESAAVPMVSVEPKSDQSHSKGQQPSQQQQQQQQQQQFTVLQYIQQPENGEFRGICKMLTIAVAYSANYGGTPTLTGTPPNLVLNNNLATNFGNKTPFNFGSWFLFAFPISISCLLLAWIWLQFLFLGPRNLCRGGGKSPEEAEAVQRALKSQYEKLGPITFPEVSCIILFGATVLLWISRTGWSPLFTTKTRDGDTRVYMSDAQPALLMSILLFVLPSRNPFKRRPTAQQGDDAAKEDETAARPQASTLLTWQAVHERLPWGIVILLGGGFALAKATKESGLSLMIGDQLKPLGALPRPLMVLIVTYCTTFITEITSNTATASILLPILVDLCRSIRMNPLALMLPCTIAASLAFNLPVATPPNSIVFSKGYLTVADMIKSGFVLTIVSGLVVVGASLTYGTALFNMTEYPDWAGNFTAPAG
uniref:CitMHS domain-containing protein n=1 Tax=Macrostomum lignano TaxID=282301 RepID=A0A1I8IFM9_9PLAT